MKTSIKILSIILIILLISCQQKVERKVYKTTDGKGYCYQDDNSLLWYLLIYNNTTHSYDVVQTSNVPSYDISSSETVSVSSDLNNSVEITESAGEDVGGSDYSNDSDGSGMSESSGYDSSSSDSSSSDSGGGGE